MTTPTQQIKNFLNKSANAFEENSSFPQLEQALYNAEKAVIKLRTLVEENYSETQNSSNNKICRSD